MYGNNDSGFMMMLLVVLLVVLFFAMRTRKSSSSKAATTETSKKTSSAQMREDIKATKTSRVVDQVEILEELGGTSQGFRQYCELVGTSQKDGGVTAPYSGRAVAYYDVKCYRLEHVNGVDRETLVAHETSIDPFYFKDASCDTPVYVDLKSFGSNIILVNSTNHVEGPNSQFSQAFNQNSSTPGTSGSVYAIMGELRDAASRLLANVASRLPRYTPSPRFAFAGAAAGMSGSVSYKEPEHRNVMFATKGNSLGSKGNSLGSKGMGSRPPQPPRSSRPSQPMGAGYGRQMPQNLGSFLGGGYGSVFGMPTRSYPRMSSGPDLGGILVGMTLGSLLRQVNSANTQRTVVQPQAPVDTFRGYRIVEDVVPLGSPTYCIGEIFKQGTDVYMGRSLAEDYPTSFFACRPEAEVLSALGA